jgi:hypothetical protein
MIANSFSSSVYNGYSFGDRAYEEFPLDCLKYHVADPDPEHHFVFTVYKRTEKMIVSIHSWEMFFELYSILGDFEACSDGLLLLKHLTTLERHLDSMRNDPSIATSNLTTELSLLVEGLLADNEPFLSFGIMELYERGCINEERWRSFQNTKV